MFYEGYHFWGMHLIWWFLWFIFLFWIFALPYDVPGRRFRSDAPLDILQRRFAKGEINKDSYLEMKRVIENDSAKK
jgi:putative membrane protein